MKKLCKDCKWKVFKWFPDFSDYCGHPELVDRVTGKPTIRCWVYRISTCGGEGKYWEKKEEK